MKDGEDTDDVFSFITDGYDVRDLVIDSDEEEHDDSSDDEIRRRRRYWWWQHSKVKAVAMKIAVNEHNA